MYWLLKKHIVPSQPQRYEEIWKGLFHKTSHQSGQEIGAGGKNSSLADLKSGRCQLGQNLSTDIKALPQIHLSLTKIICKSDADALAAGFLSLLKVGQFRKVLRQLGRQLGQFDLRATQCTMHQASWQEKARRGCGAATLILAGKLSGCLSIWWEARWQEDGLKHHSKLHPGQEIAGQQSGQNSALLQFKRDSNHLSQESKSCRN